MNNKVLNATKWSFVTELVAKLISPITNMILARLLVPEMFGVITTITMVISFADIFSDAGFQKYLVQHEFENEEQLYESSGVAFTINLFISFVLWIGITVFSTPIMKMLGNEGKEVILIVACASLPLTSFSSIQIALYKRKFEFKKLFYIRIIGSVVPLLVTVPLAWIFRNYWALVIGTICGNLVNAIALTVMSSWNPKLAYKYQILKEMWSFSMWTLCESILTWFTSYVDVFIIGTILSTYYIGIYKTSMTTINQILALITGATNTVLFTTLSRVQNDDSQFNKIFLDFQHLASYIIVPMGVGIFAYRDFVTGVLLGSQWNDAIGFIGIWGLVGGFYVILGGYCTEAYRSKGKPKVSTIAQFIYIIVIFIIIEKTKKISFEAIYISRTLSRVLFIGIHFIIMKKICKISPMCMVKNIMPAFSGATFMYLVSLILKKISNNFIWCVISIIICIFAYFCFLLLLPKSRKEIIPYIDKIRNRR